MKTSATRLLIRADAGPSVGTGHVMRMMALAQACRKLKVDVSFVCGALPSGLVTRLEKSGCNVFRIGDANGGAADALNTSDIADSISPDWILLDGYCFDDNYQARVARSNARLMVIDDYGHAQHVNADLIVNQNVYARAEIYSLTTQQRAEILCGAQYVMLRSEFGDSTGELQNSGTTIRQTRRPTRPQARRILLTMGGCDEANWTLKAVEALGEMTNSNGKLSRILVDVVLGAGYRHDESKLQAMQSKQLVLRIHNNVGRMSALMKKVDMAISAGGSTCYELANCGVPTIAIPLAENQKPVVAELVARGTLRGVESTDPQELKQQTESLITDQQARREMALAGQRLIDGLGANRIARRLVGAYINLRSASMDDAKMLFDWRNDPEVRSVSFSSDPVEWESHRRWLDAKLRDRDCDLWIAEDRTGLAFGQVRLDHNRADSTAMISVSIDHASRARGSGTVLLDKACRTAFADNPSLDQIVAQIKPGNQASERAFKKTGFGPMEPTTICDQLAHQYTLRRPEAMQTTQRRRSA